MRRVLMMALVVCLVPVFAFGGGQGEAPGDGTGELQLSEPGEYPIVPGDEEYVFTAMSGYDPSESSGDPGESQFADYLADLTNIRVEFDEVTNFESYQERQALRLASGDVPDVVLSPFSMSAQNLYNNGLNGTFIPLTDLIEERMPNFQERLDEWPQYRDQLVMPDGEIYALPTLEAGCYHCKYSYKYWMYEPWLDAVGMEMPETTEELYEVLKAFKTQDPNGNGKADEIPFAGATTGWQPNPMGYIMNAFIFTNLEENGAFIRRIDGGAEFVADTEEWRNGLRYMNRLVDEGLLASESFVWKEDQLKSLVENPGVARIGSFSAGWYGIFSINGGGTGRFADLKPVPPLEGPDGVRQSFYAPAAVEYHVKITPDAEHPEAIAQWADWFYGEPIAERKWLSMAFFKQGEWWRWATEQEKQEQVTRDGQEPQIVFLQDYDYGPESKPFDAGWPRIAPRWEPIGFKGLSSDLAEDPSRQEWRLMVATRDLYEPYQSAHFIPPNVVFPEDVTDEISDLTETVASENGLVQQWSAEFIVGQRDINSDEDWNEYLQALETAGANRYEELWDEALSNY